MLRSLRLLSLATVLATAACSGSQSVGEPTATADTATSVAPISVTVHGAGQAVVGALSQVALRADQRATITQMAQDAETRSLPVRQAREALIHAIANQVQAGTVDRTALQPQIDALIAAQKAAHAGDRAAFQKLHDLLTADQRVAFVTALQNNFEAQKAQHGQHGQKQGRLQKLATELGLTQAQQDTIRQNITAQFQTHFANAVGGAPNDTIQDGQMVAAGHEWHQKMQQALEAFKTDSFSVDTALPQPTAQQAHDFAGHMLTMVETSLPVLTADQRAALAQHLHARAANMEQEEEPAKP